MPKSPGVYFFLDTRGKVIYVGKARSLRDRVCSYFATPLSELLPKTALLVQEVSKINHIVVESEVDALLLEANYIRKLQPKYNILGKDGKNYPLIEISIKDKIPLVKIVHQETDHKKLYFGPYPTGSDIRSLLRYLRHIFPFVSQPHPEKFRCFYSHIGLCPCGDKKDYKKNLKNFIDFLKGKRKSVQKKLEKEMIEAARQENFERAQEMKEKMSKIAYITSLANKPWEYELNPNLVADRLKKELEDLKKLLNLQKLEKIECYDISNTSGKLATGAQVTFLNGVPEKKLYRRYRIHLKTPTGGPDDSAMVSEVLGRRMKSDNPMPDLFVIDGGKGQVSSATNIVKKIPVIGLAKRLETIVTTEKEIQMSLNSPALHLLQRMRDESHRFSRKYHFLLRHKKMLELSQ